MWLGKLTMLDMTPLGWLGRKTSTLCFYLSLSWLKLENCQNNLTHKTPVTRAEDDIPEIIIFLYHFQMKK